MMSFADFRVVTPKIRFCMDGLANARGEWYNQKARAILGQRQLYGT